MVKKPSPPREKIGPDDPRFPWTERTLYDVIGMIRGSLGLHTLGVMRKPHDKDSPMPEPWVVVYQRKRRGRIRMAEGVGDSQIEALYRFIEGYAYGVNERVNQGARLQTGITKVREWLNENHPEH